MLVLLAASETVAARNGTGMLAMILALDADQASVQMFLFQLSKMQRLCGSFVYLNSRDTVNKLISIC